MPVCFSEAIYDEKSIVEGVVCEKANNIDEIYNILDKGNIPIIIDPYGNYIKTLKPLAVVDAILAKKNLGTNKSMAPINYSFRTWILCILWCRYSNRNYERT